MKKLIKLTNLFLIFTLLHSCGGMSDAAKVLRNEKITNTDEFLVKKRQPLVLPPDYKNLPKPDAIQKTDKTTESTLDKILKIEDEKKTGKTKTSSVEQSIINRINK